MQSIIVPALSNSKDNSVKWSRLQFGCARITSAICGSVNLIFVVGFIEHIKRDQAWFAVFTPVGRFVPCAGFVTLRQTFVLRCHSAANGCRPGPFAGRAGTSLSFRWFIRSLWMLA